MKGLEKIIGMINGVESFTGNSDLKGVKHVELPGGSFRTFVLPDKLVATKTWGGC